MEQREKEKIKLKLFLSGLTFRDIANEADVSPQFISNILAGRDKASAKTIKVFRKHGIELETADKND